MKEATYSIQAKSSTFLFKRVGDVRSMEFKSLREAIKHAQTLPHANGARLVLLNEKGTGGIAVDL